MRCRNCEYWIDNLAVHRCPECGTSFDPNDSSTFLYEPRQRIIPSLLAACAVSFPISFLVILFRRPGRTTDDVLRAVFLALIATAIASVILLALFAYSAHRHQKITRRTHDQNRHNSS